MKRFKTVDVLMRIKFFKLSRKTGEPAEKYISNS
jgi:hypothetical protein